LNYNKCGLKYFKKLLVSIVLFSFFESRAQLFNRIPKNIFQPYKVFGELPKNDIDRNNKINYKLVLDSFEISNQITYQDYKIYLSDIKRDSSYAYYLKQLPDSTIASKENYREYTSHELYDSYPIIGISWEAAENFCKWKTHKQNKNEIKFLYRLPKLSEWLNAFNYLEEHKIVHDFSKDFSDWTLSTYFEYNNGIKNDFIYDMHYEAKENDPLRLKRKIAMGDSYLYQKENLHDHWRGFYSFKGYRQIAFRIVKQRLDSINSNDKINKVL
jgi:hypothetical protein